MQVLVTGGAGFIGSHVVDALLSRGHRVRVLDDFSTGRRGNLAAGAEVLQGSVADPDAVASSVAGCDVVVHLAAIASVPRSVENPIETHEANLTGTIRILEAMRGAGTRRIVYASSAAVYGAIERPQQNECDPPDPLTPYAIDKLAGEQYLAFFQREHGIDARSLRFFNVFGPRQDPSSPYSGVISIFGTRLLAGEPLLIHGNGTQTRDFVYVQDVVDVLVRHVEDPASDAPSPMHVCRGAGTSLLDLVGMLESVTGSSAHVRHGPPRPGDIRHSVGDPGRLTAWMAHGPRTSVLDGLQETLDWMRRSMR